MSQSTNKYASVSSVPCSMKFASWCKQTKLVFWNWFWLCDTEVVWYHAWSSVLFELYCWNKWKRSQSSLQPWNNDFFTWYIWILCSSKQAKSFFDSIIFLLKNLQCWEFENMMMPPMNFTISLFLILVVTKWERTCSQKNMILPEPTHMSWTYSSNK